MKLEEDRLRYILERHEKETIGADLAKIEFKERVYMIWAAKQERIRDAINAKRMRRQAKFLARVLGRLSEKKQAEADRIERMNQMREIMRRQALMSASKPSVKESDIDTMTEEGYYMAYAMMSMRLRDAKGKRKKPIEEAMMQLREKMKEKGYATDIAEISELIQLIPEEERKRTITLAQRMKLL